MRVVHHDSPRCSEIDWEAFFLHLTWHLFLFFHSSSSVFSPLPHCPSPVFLLSLIVFKSLFISPFLFQFYLFNWFVCFTRQEMHSSHSLGRLHITHFGNVKSSSPHIWSASLCVSAVQVRWFKRWLTAMIDLLFLLLISAVHNNVLTKYESGLEVARGLFTVTHAILGEHGAAKWRSCFTGTESKKNKKKDLRHI